MSVYTPQQIHQPQLQQPYDLQQFGQQRPWGLQAQQPVGQQGLDQFSRQQAIGIQGHLPVLLTELSLRCAATAVSAVMDQLRANPQFLSGIHMQSQVPPHAWSQVLAECARRITPVVHSTLIQITGQGQDGPSWGQVPDRQPHGWPAQFPGQFQGQGGFAHQPQYGQMPSPGI
ncbi:hypothetical protein ACFV2N_44470 [Streptomyces sp. NPDC059680]|uniref:hypothetical protein n=1 Tax=Streptomyces sp. NPDC059680 TaxID=3346904 RepID=UPI0036AD6B9E